jgi:hypothetical protein
MIFENIKSIVISNPSTWQDKIFLTFDLDWCSDEVLSYTLDIIEKCDIKATFFVTHNTPLLERMRANPKIELGIHPNFNFLLEGDFRYGKNIKEIIKYYKDIVPEAVSVRSHSLAQSSKMLDIFEEFGLIYDCNTFIPFSSGIEVRPYNITNKLIKVPHFWEDDVHCLYRWDWNVKKFLEYKGIKVFDFHPMHIFLNTEDFDRYKQIKANFNSKYELSKYRYSGYGTHTFLLDLIGMGI